MFTSFRTTTPKIRFAHISRQHLGGRLTITMLRHVGEPINVHEVDEDTMKASIQKLHYLQSHLLPYRNPGEPYPQPNYEPTDTSQA